MFANACLARKEHLRGMAGEWGTLTLSLDMMLEMLAGCSTYTKITKRIYCNNLSGDETFYMLAT